MKSAITLLFIFLSAANYAQMEAWVEVRPKIGFLVAHRSIMGHVAKEHAYATEVSYYFKGNGEKTWHSSYNQPRFGVSAFVGSVGNMELMGMYYGGYGFMSVPLIHFPHYEFAGRFGAGLSFAPKVYNAETNNLSIGTSTHLNAMISFSVENRWQFGPHAINFMVDMTHFSNGAIKVPNLGLNLPYMSLGYGHKIREAQKEITMDAFDNRYWEFGVIGFVSAKEEYPVGGKKFPVFGLNLAARRYFKANVGAEISLDGMYKSSLRAYHPDVPITNSELLQLGIFTGYILPFNRFHLVVGMGYYLRDKFHFQEVVYHRVGMRYVFDSGININLALKSHWARADYFEYGIGYTFKR